MSSYKERLIEILKKHDPDKVPKADALLKKYEGSEEKFLAQLKKKYEGGAAATPSAASEKESSPPATPKAGAATGGGGGGSYKERLVALLSKHDPEKVPKADALLKKYEGTEEKFLAQLAKKYGASTEGETPRASETTPSPTAASEKTPKASEESSGGGAKSYKERLVEILQKHDPDKVPKADALLKKYEGTEEKFLTQLAKKYGFTTPSETPRATTTPAAAETPRADPAPPASPQKELTYKERLVALLKVHDPEKVAKADALLKKYEGTEEKFLAQLAKKYGATETPRPSAEPAPASEKQETTTPAPAATTSQPASPKSYKERLIEILKKHDPDKVPKADALLKKYEGSEEKFLGQLEKKYAGSASPGATASPGGDSKPATPSATTTPSATAASSAAAGAEEGKTEEVKLSAPLQSEPPKQATPQSDSAPVSGSSTPRSTAGSGAGGERSLIPQDGGDNNNNNHEQEGQQQKPQQQQVVVNSGPSDAERRRLAHRESLLTAATLNFCKTKIDYTIQKKWFQIWRAAGQQKVVDRLRQNTCDNTLPGQLVEALGEANVKPATWIRVRALREQLQLANSPSPQDASGVGRAIDEVVATSYEFVTIKHQADVRKAEENAMAETRRLVELLQRAEQDSQELEKKINVAEDRQKLLQLNLEDADREIDNLTNQLNAQTRLTARASAQAKKLQENLAKEQRGVPSDVELRLEQKDELASHLHKQLATCRSSVNTWKDQCEQMASQLAEERDRRVRAEQRVEVLSVALCPPETLGITADHNSSNSTAREGSTSSSHHQHPSGMSIAESVRLARENNNTNSSYLSPHNPHNPENNKSSKAALYQEQAQLLAAARKALQTEGSATGGDVPRRLAAFHAAKNPNSASATAAASSSSTSSSSQQREYSNERIPPPPPTGEPPANAIRSPQEDRMGLNQTPALENNNNNNNIASPSPMPTHPSSSSSSSSALVVDESGGVSCPNCETVKLTAFNGSRFSTNSSDMDKVAFCFSCRKTFSQKDLDQMSRYNNIKQKQQQQHKDANNVSAASSSSKKSVPRSSQQSVSRAAIPESLKNSVLKLASQRSTSN